MTISKPVIVVGGGWAGLTVAVELVRHDIPVILLESAKQVGGRARRVPFDNKLTLEDQDFDELDLKSGNNTDKISVDNGQHLLIGAYDSTLRMLRTVGVNEESVLKREKLVLNMRRINKRDVRIETSRLPAPLHLAWGLLFASGLSITDRARALQFCRTLMKTDFTIPSDESCLEMFRRNRQTKTAIKIIWEPLCIATLNTPIATASATVFLRVLREAFAHTRSESDLLFTRADLGEVFPDRAMDYIEKHGGNVRLGQRVTDLIIENQQLKGLKLQEGDIEAEHVVLATPQFAARKLLAPHSMFADLAEQLDKLGSQPIVTVYLQYPENTTLDTTMMGFIDTTTQWVVDRRINGQPGLMSVVISSSGPHMDMDNNQLCETVENELASFYPAWPKPLSRMVIREKRATFDCACNSNAYRPGNDTALSGLWLAGDYTDTQLPATLESAVRSGKRCAKAVIKVIHQSGDNN